MNRRTKGRSNMDQAAEELQKHYHLFEMEFFDFFKMIQKEASAELNRLTI
jgi:acyl carrier protein phosphodiesterase